MSHSVDMLHLAVHTPPGREAAAARLAEQFTRDVLEQFSQTLEARSPGRVVLIRRMAVRWSLSETEMTDPASAASCAAELADSVAVGGNGASHVADTIATFDDEAGWLAAYLRARAAGAAGAWFHAAWRQAESRDTTRASPLHRQTVLAALSRLRATGELAGVLAALPAATTNALGVALGSDRARPSWTDETVATQARWPPDAVPGDGLSIGRLHTDRQVGDRRGGEPDDGPADASAPAQANLRLRDDMATNEPGTAAGASRPPPDAALVGGAAALIAAVAQRLDDGPHHPVAPASRVPQAPDGPTGVVTRFGGLFYLLALALELGIGESLWKVCLSEGPILAHAAAVLLGTDAAGDPAPAAFGGVTPGEPCTCPPVSPEQQAEVSIELLTATAAALPRSGIAPPPEVSLDLATSPAGRMLVASGLGTYALFAWPAPDARAAAAGVAAFLSVWPGSFPPPRAHEVLLGLDTSRRLRSASGLMTRASPLLPAAPTAPAAALLAQISGAMSELFAARAGDASVGTCELVSRYLAIPGRVVLEPAAMTVVLPMAATDLAVRRAALDRDPGWVAWLGQTVRIEFAPEGGGDVV